MTVEQYISLGKRTAIFSFLSGTIIFLLYFFTSESILLLVGYAFIVVVGLLNLVVLIAISIKLSKEKESTKKLVRICVFMMLNMPIMISYCWLTTILLDTVRITFTNSTKFELSNINITGCEKKIIDKLETGESKTIWIDIPNECEINIEYLSNGQRQIENVVGYATEGKIKHSIGDQK